MALATDITKNNDGSPRRVSSLARRIMAVNVLTLAMLVGGLLYLDQFRRDLTSSRIDEMKVQARIIAGALGETAFRGADGPEISKKAAGQILLRLVALTGARARLYDLDGKMIADSRQLLRSDVLQEPLPAQNMWQGLQSWWRGFYDKLMKSLGRRPVYPPYVEIAPSTAADYPETLAALKGEEAVQLRAIPGEGRAVVIGVALPVLRFKQVLGGMLLTADTRDVETIIRNERMNIAKICLISLGVTMLMALYLGSTVARPVRRLAGAAYEVARHPGRQVEIPDFTERQDEIGELSAALRTMMEALYRQISAIESFAADVAHEIKNPLTSLRSAVETLERSQNPDHQKPLLGIIKDDVSRLNRLITDISDASRLDAELARSETTSVDMRRLLETMTDIYHSRARASGPRLALSFGSEEPMRVTGIEGRIGQVIRNLLDNALSFSPDTSIIRLHARREDDAVVVTVEDDGPGLPPDKVQAVFSRFYTERPAGEQFGQHSGLGLSICKQIVEASGGRIWAENIKSAAEDKIKGARFSVLLPIAG